MCQNAGSKQCWKNVVICILCSYRSLPPKIIKKTLQKRNANYNNLKKNSIKIIVQIVIYLTIRQKDNDNISKNNK